MESSWPSALPVAQVRVARPTDKLKEIERFYCTGVGLPKIGSFENHNGYDGIMIGLPDFTYHLEFTQHIAGSPCPAPSKYNLLVLYLPYHESIKQVAARLATMGYLATDPENIYWKNKKALTIEDPDGWRLVLMPTSGIL